MKIFFCHASEAKIDMQQQAKILIIAILVAS